MRGNIGTSVQKVGKRCKNDKAKGKSAGKKEDIAALKIKGKKVFPTQFYSRKTT